MSATVTVRMYNQENLGDCFLLKFTDGVSRSWLLIDFGSYEGNNTERELEIARDILDAVKDDPFNVVLTHQHKDHLSGFINAAPVLEKREIDEIWLSYLDDPNGNKAKDVRDIMKKYWDKNNKITGVIQNKFGNVNAVRQMLKAKESFDLFAELQTGGDAIRNLLEWSRNRRRFLLPGEHFDMPGLPAGLVRVYTLGPPVDPALLKKMNPGKDEAVNSLNAMSHLLNIDSSTDLLLNALDPLSVVGGTAESIENFPLNKRFVCKENTHPLQGEYENPDHSWRTIDHEWLSEMGNLALHMDALTNNSSLVLAFELVALKKVLLFVGDAQIGNWSSWLNVKFEGSKTTAEDLLTRTVLYKAGHHSSHNATLRKSLDLMNSEELVIMIPVNQPVATKRGFAMLKPGMLMGYNRKSKGRVLRSDTVFHKAGAVNSYQFPFAGDNGDFKPAVKVVQDQKKTGHLYVEYEVK